MATIIEFGKKAEHLKSERETSIRQRKIEALRKIFQCTRCMVKCAKCGAQTDSQADERGRFAAPYSFCRSCQQEYEEYRARVGGNQPIRTVTGIIPRGCGCGRPGSSIRKRSTSTGSRKSSSN